MVLQRQLNLAADALLGHGRRPMRRLLHLGHMDVLLLLVAQQRMEERVHDIGVRDLVGRIEQRDEEVPDLGQSTLGHGFDIRPADVDAAGQAV